tara:strand:- start:5282 stop:5848 length:567 start_codon:yes stop_codon:yes gene_type:complete
MANEWTENFDNSTEVPYFYNHMTKEFRWKIPSNVVVPPPSPPRSSDTIWIVRISLRVGAKKAQNDYNILKEALASNDSDIWKKYGVWDKDTKNKMKPGSWLGFIIGEINDAMVELFYIEGETKTYRPDHWNKVDDYTDQKTTIQPDTRETVIFKKQNIIRMSWKEWKTKVEYKEKYMPRGTTTSKNPY